MSKIVARVDGQDVQAHVEAIGPEEAAVYLDRNDANRRISPKTVARYARAMQRGDWRFVADPIRFDRDGVLRDGQHRLAAIVQSGTTHELLVVYGLASDTQQYMDQGRPRTAGDQLKMSMGVMNSNAWASAIRMLIRWDAGDVLGQMLVPETPEILEFADDHRDALERAIPAGIRVRGRLGTGSPSVSAAAYFRAEQVDPAMALRFWRDLAEGEGLTRGDPVFALREAISRRRVLDRWTGEEELYAYVRSWSACRTGTRMLKIQFPTGGQFTEDHFRI